MGRVGISTGSEPRKRSIWPYEKRVRVRYAAPLRVNGGKRILKIMYKPPGQKYIFQGNADKISPKRMIKIEKKTIKTRGFEKGCYYILWCGEK